LLELYIDGQSVGNEQKGSPRRARIAVVFEPTSRLDAKVFWQNVGNKTNNEAEYLALLKALFIINKPYPTRNDAGLPTDQGMVTILSDSELIVNQVRGTYEVRDVKLKGLWEEARSILGRMKNVDLKWVRREENFAGLWLEGRWKGGVVEELRD